MSGRACPTCGRDKTLHDRVGGRKGQRVCLLVEVPPPKDKDPETYPTIRRPDVKEYRKRERARDKKAKKKAA